MKRIGILLGAVVMTLALALGVWALLLPVLSKPMASSGASNPTATSLPMPTATTGASPTSSVTTRPATPTNTRTPPPTPPPPTAALIDPLMDAGTIADNIKRFKSLTAEDIAGILRDYGYRYHGGPPEALGFIPVEPPNAGPEVHFFPVQGMSLGFQVIRTTAVYGQPIDVLVGLYGFHARDTNVVVPVIMGVVGNVAPVSISSQDLSKPRKYAFPIGEGDCRLPDCETLLVAGRDLVPRARDIHVLVLTRIETRYPPDSKWTPDKAWFEFFNGSSGVASVKWGEALRSDRSAELDAEELAALMEPVMSVRLGALPAQLPRTEMIRFPICMKVAVTEGIADALEP